MRYLFSAFPQPAGPIVAILDDGSVSRSIGFCNEAREAGALFSIVFGDDFSLICAEFPVNSSEATQVLSLLVARSLVIGAAEKFRNGDTE